MAISAVINLGTNTFRLFVAEVTANEIIPIYSENQITRLGEGFSHEKRFLPSAMERAVRTLTAFKTTLGKYPVDHLYVVGTSGFREAVNRDLLLLAIHEQVGFDVEVITGEEEARYTFLGADLILHHREGPMLLIDIGGGSAEFIIATAGIPKQLISIPLGVVRLTEQYLKSDPSTQAECASLKDAILKSLFPMIAGFPQKAFFAGTAGTLTTIAAIDQEMIDYDPDKINGTSVSKEAVESILMKLLSLSKEARCQVPGLERGREDLIIPGLLIVLVLMEQCHYDQVYVSDYGLREGVLIDRYRISNDQ